jgi:hypothetical protein
MKTTSLLIILSVLTILLSCEDDESIMRQSIPITTGEQLDIFIDLLPDSIIEPFENCSTVNSLVVCEMECGSLEIDFNKDSKNDIEFTSCIGTTLADLNTKTSSVKIIDTAYQVLISPFLVDVPISNTNNWGSTRFIYLSKKTGGIGLQEDFNDWTEFKYLAFRRLTPNDTLFGWIKLKIEDYNQLTIDSYSMQK